MNNIPKSDLGLKLSTTKGANFKERADLKVEKFNKGLIPAM
jgi:hypothetical protein